MKNRLLLGMMSLLALSAVIGITGCGTGGSNANPDSQDPANVQIDNRDLAYQQGFRAGRFDATDRKTRNYTRSQALYNMRTVGRFRSGYKAGYDAHSGPTAPY